MGEISETKFIAAVPVLPSLDVLKAVAFYRDILGFTVLAVTETPYAVLSHEGVNLHLWQCEDSNLPHNSGCRFLVDGINDLFKKLEPLGIVNPDAPLEKKPWGIWEFGICDLDNNYITFVELVPEGEI